MEKPYNQIIDELALSTGVNKAAIETILAKLGVDQTFATFAKVAGSESATGIKLEDMSLGIRYFRNFIHH